MNDQLQSEASPSAQGPKMDAEQLAEAFALFSRASDELSHAYNALQGQVVQLSERLNVLMGALPAGVVVLDRNSRVIQANVAAEHLFGEGLEGRNWVELSLCFQSGQTPGEVAMPLNGELRQLAVSEAEMQSGEGRIVLLHDVTDTQRMRLQAERNARLAAMGEMVAGLAHQLRTPLSAALLYTASLKQPDLMPADRGRVADRAMERLRYLERLIRDMLLFARGDSLGRQVFAVAELMEELGQVLSPVAKAKGLTFHIDCSDRQSTLHGDRKALGGALTNLLENAIQASETGSRIGFTAHTDKANVQFMVSDSGKGIDPALQERLFEPFFTTRAEGTGLGLAIARGVARAHGGDIAIQSAPGQGATFILTLPLATEHL